MKVSGEGERVETFPLLLLIWVKLVVIWVDLKKPC